MPEPITIEEVDHWCIEKVDHWCMLSGIGHVVTSANGHWVTTACHHWMTGSVVTERPKRICRRCRAAFRSRTPEMT